MTNENSKCARDLLQVALELLDDRESLVAAAMISGAIEVLGREPSHLDLHARVTPIRRIHDVRQGSYRSCA